MLNDHLLDMSASTDQGPCQCGVLYSVFDLGDIHGETPDTSSQVCVWGEQDFTRLSSTAKVQMASGQGSHLFIESPTRFHLCVTRPPEIFFTFF